MRRVLSIALFCIVSLAAVAWSASRFPMMKRPATIVHHRLQTSNGPVHVFAPEGYASKTAGIVVYVHGYYTDVDTAWNEHQLEAQFTASKRNALFIVPEAPQRDDDGVRWQSLPELLDAVREVVELPNGPLIAVAHSGGFRTITPWLSASGHLIEQVVLLDGLYGGEDKLRDWLSTHGKRPGSLTLVGFDTRPQMNRFNQGFTDSQSLDKVPEVDRATVRLVGRLVSIHSQFGHMEIVTSGLAIPPILQLTSLEPLNSQRS